MLLFYQQQAALIMYKAYKFRIYPTYEQQIALAKSFGCCRWFWNYSLSLCEQTYTATGKSLSRGAIQGLLPALKKEYAWLSNAYSQCLQSVALNLSSAYKNFFENRARLPKFKSKHSRQSISYPAKVTLEGGYVSLPGKIGKVRCKQERKFEGKIKTVTISQNPDSKYFASVLVDDGKEAPMPLSQGKVIGIDLGLTHFCITSDGSKFDNPRHIKKYARNLKKKQQSLSRKQIGSNNRHKARKLVAKVRSFIARVRADFLHKLSRKMVNENQVIAVENLYIKGMVRNHNLAKAISDCGWSQFCAMLKYKSQWEGKTYIEVDRFFASSKTCSLCLNQVASLPLNIRYWTCNHCQSYHDRDVNAATNIKNEALRILSLGTSDTANRGNVSQPGKTSVLLDAIPYEVGNPILRKMR